VRTVPRFVIIARNAFVLIARSKSKDWERFVWINPDPKPNNPLLALRAIGPECSLTPPRAWAACSPSGRRWLAIQGFALLDHNRDFSTGIAPKVPIWGKGIEPGAGAVGRQE
jgi:hypothetical protein